MATKTRVAIDEDVIRGLADQLSRYLADCRMGGAAEVQDAVKRAARRHGWSFGELWSEVHQLATRSTMP